MLDPDGKVASWNREGRFEDEGWRVRQEEDRRRTREAGFTHHLTKPVPPQTLKGILSSLA